MRGLVLAGSILLASPAVAETWAFGNCTTSRNQGIAYGLHDGEGFISYDGSKSAPIFSKREGDLGIITQIGNSGNMTMAINLNTGCGYIITRFDSGKVVEANVYCKLTSTER